MLPALDKYPTLHSIFSRTSVRSFTDEAVDQDILDTLAQAGMAAPSAGNRQPWEFIITNNLSTLQSLAQKLPHAKMLGQAPAAIVVCGNLAQTFPDVQQPFWIQDCSAASQNILLAAHALGLGAVWVGVHPLKEREATVAELFHLPPHVTPLNVIAVGHPDRERSGMDKWKEDKVHWQRWTAK